jgi:hypothetical protein
MTMVEFFDQDEARGEWLLGIGIEFWDPIIPVMVLFWPKIEIIVT